MPAISSNRSSTSFDVPGLTYGTLPISLIQARVERVAQAVADEVEGKHRGEDGEPRDGGQGGGGEAVVAGLAEHLAPLGCRKLDAQAEKAEAGGEQDREPHRQRRLNDERGERVGDHVPDQDQPVRYAQRYRRLDERQLSQAQRVR